MERQYTASAYVIDYQTKEVLLMYNKKIEKWLQPGGHIEETETPIEAAIREVKQETGIDIKIISTNNIDNTITPIYIDRFVNKVGDMIDIQYLAIPLNKKLFSSENNEYGWFTLEKIQTINVASDIKEKVENILKQTKLS